MRNINFIFIA